MANSLLKAKNEISSVLLRILCGVQSRKREIQICWRRQMSKHSLGQRQFSVLAKSHFDTDLGMAFIWSIFGSLSVMAGNDWKIKEVSFLLIFVSAAGLITFDVCGSWNILSFSLHFRSPAWKGLSKFRAPGHFYKSSPKYFWQLRNNKISRTLLTYNLYSINHPQAWWPSLVLLSSFSFPWFFTFKGDLQKYKHCFCGGCC